MAQNPDDITYFATTNARGKMVPFGIKRIDRARHMYVIGKTGMGKSTLLENLAIQDVRNGEGMAFIDPHGGTADKLLSFVPEHRIKDVVYIAPFDTDFPVAFNVMEDVGYDRRHLVVSGLMSAFAKIWVDAWSARMEYILSNTLFALLEYPDATLLDVNRMLVNKTFRKKVIEHISDPIVKSFWTEEFANYTDKYAAEATPAIQNKIGQFTNNPLIRNIIGQPKSTFDFRQAMDEKKIIIINLSKGRIGETNAQLLGSMLVTKIYLAAMSRADIPAHELAELPNFYFYVDEFQSFANKSFADILSEARKYKLNLIITHQFVAQMEDEVRDAVFGNVGTTISFRVGPFDAETLETIFKPRFMATDLVNLGFAQIYLTLMIDGVGSPPFSAQTLAPFEVPPQQFTETVLSASRAIYAQPRAEVEAAIAEHEKMDAEAPKPTKTFTESSSRAASPRSTTSSYQPKIAPVEATRPVTPVARTERVERTQQPVELPPQAREERITEQPVHAAPERVAATPTERTPEMKRVSEPRPQPSPKREESRSQTSARRDEPTRVRTSPTQTSSQTSSALRDALAAVVKEPKKQIVTESAHTTPTTHNNETAQPEEGFNSLREALAQLRSTEKEAELAEGTPVVKNGLSPKEIQELLRVDDENIA